MEEEENVSLLSRKELRKQKLMEYLAAKGKLKLPNHKPYLRDDCHIKNPDMSALKMIKEKENMAPANKETHKCKKVPDPNTKALKNPTRRAFGATIKVDAKGSIISRTERGQQIMHRSSATSIPSQPKLNRKPLLTETISVTSSISKLNSTGQYKKKPNIRMESSDRISSSSAQTAAANPNNIYSRRSSAALLCPVKTASVRISLGPIVKTKTGLIPAVTKPRNSTSQTATQPPALPAAFTSVTACSNKARSSTLSSVLTSQRKTVSINNPVEERKSHSSTARAGIKVQEKNRTNAKTLFGKSSQTHFNSQPAGLKTGTISTKSTAWMKPGGRTGLPKPDKSTSQPSDTQIAKKKSEDGVKKKGQLLKVVSRVPSGPASRSSSRVGSGVSQAAVAQPVKTTETCRGAGGTKRHCSANVPNTKQGIMKIGTVVFSQTAPQPVRTISLTGQARKTPKVPVKVIPQTEGKKLTAVQEERLRKLQEWREAKGISYKRPPMPVRPQIRRTVAVPQPFWASMTEEDEAHSLISAVDRSLADCIKLLAEGCSTDQVKEVLSRLPAVSHKFAKYWICQARLMEQEGNLDVLPMFEKAVGVILEPVDDLRAVVFEILKKKDDTQASNEEEEDQQNSSDVSPSETVDNPMMTPKPVRALICGEKGNSSVVKYKITATPGGPQSQKKEPARVNGQEVRFFTPVRRSVRIERASLRYPASLQDHDLCVASYNDLISEEDTEGGKEHKDEESSMSANKTPMYIYRQNEALEDKVFVQLVFDEGV